MLRLRAMTNDNDKLARLVADLQKAVIGLELKRGREERRPDPKPPQRRAA